MLKLTLDNELMIPDIDGYTPQFGTKIQYTETNKGGLSTREVNNNILLPFSKQRAFTIRNTEYTSNIEFDSKIIIDASDNISLTLGAATYVGCRVVIINKSNYNQELLCTSPRQTGRNFIQKGSSLELMWDGNKWININAPEKNIRIIQYPQEKSPTEIFPCTEWEEKEFNGAFFRTYKNGISGDFSVEGSQLQFQQNQTSSNGLSFNGTRLQNTNKDPGWSKTVTGSSHTHEVNVPYGRIYGYYDSNLKTAEMIYYGPYMVTSSSKRQDWWDNFAGVNFYGNKNFSVSGHHKHYFTPEGTIKSRDTETRPQNYTIKIWERTA